MRSTLLFLFSLLLGFAWMAIDIQMTSRKEKALDDFAQLSKIYTLQIEKNDFVYRTKE